MNAQEGRRPALKVESRWRSGSWKFAGFCLVAGAILAAFHGPPLLWGGLFALGLLLALRRGR